MKFLLILFSLFFSLQLTSQSSGKITFEEKFDLHRNLPEEREDMKAMIPQYSSAFFELTFTDQESVYYPQKESEETAAQGVPTRGGPMRFGRENRTIYKNMTEDRMIDSRDFMQKQFLILGPPTPRKWKIGSQQKEILGYNCMEANFRVDSVTTLKAWFTPQLSNSNGPSDYQGLPGMILQIDINEGLRTLTATNINLDSVDTSVIIAPTKGKEITSEEFEKIREEKMKEMQLHGGSGYPMMMRRN